jgi:uncharacterized membrane protein SpoIIM required for sporulation
MSTQLSEFLDSGQPRWDELNALATEAGRRPERLGAAKLARLVELYRVASSDLALARRLFPSDPVVGRLEASVVKVRGQIYDREGRKEGVATFLAATYWRLIAERWRPMLLSMAFLVVPALLGGWWALSEPATLRALLPPEFLWVTEAQSTDVGYTAPELVGFSTFVMANNIRVTLLAFVTGLTWGVLSSYMLVNNGLILGALAALSFQVGNGRLFVAAVAAHGVLELSCIVIGGGSGLALGRAMLRPGTRTRTQAMAEEAKSAGLIALGTVPWLVVAGLLEGFVSRTGTGWVPSLVIGLVIGGVFWWMVWRNRPGLGAAPTHVVTAGRNAWRADRRQRSGPRNSRTGPRPLAPPDG